MNPQLHRKIWTLGLEYRTLEFASLQGSLQCMLRLPGLYQLLCRSLSFALSGEAPLV